MRFWYLFCDMSNKDIWKSKLPQQQTVLYISDSTEFWILVALVSAASIICLCCAIFAVSWKEQKEDHGGGPVAITTYFTNL